MNCKEAAEFFYPYLDKELSPDDVAKLEAHIAECEPCMGHMEFDRALRHLVRKQSGEVKVSTDFKDRILEKLEEADS